MLVIVVVAVPRGGSRGREKKHWISTGVEGQHVKARRVFLRPHRWKNIGTHAYQSRGDV